MVIMHADVDLSVVIPYVNEYPQVAFTVQNVRDSLIRSGIVFEVILVNNFCDDVRAQGFAPDKGPEYWHRLKNTLGDAGDWLKLIDYTDKSSCWNARNAGAEAAQGTHILFLDAHVLYPPGRLQELYRAHVFHNPTGLTYLPLAYMLDAPGKELIYRMRWSKPLGVAHYVFHGWRTYNDDKATEELLREVPVMSTCGMMLSAQLFRGTLRGYPKALGIYGGGENFLNYTTAMLGKKKLVLGGPPLYHYAEARGYRWNARDWAKNRLVALFVVGGEPWLNACAAGLVHAGRLTPRQSRGIVEEILVDDDLDSRHKELACSAMYSLEEFAGRWEGNELFEEVLEWV